VRLKLSKVKALILGRSNMNELNLSPNARRRLWQCIMLLLKRAHEVEKTTTADYQPNEGLEPAMANEANKLTQQGHTTAEVGLEEIET
jgi:hypothetical protein